MVTTNEYKKNSHRKMPGDTSAPTPHHQIQKVQNNANLDTNLAAAQTISTNAPTRKGAPDKAASTAAPTKTTRTKTPTKPPASTTVIAAVPTVKPRSTKRPTKSPKPTVAPTSSPTNTTAPTTSPSKGPVQLTLAPVATDSPTKAPVTNPPTQLPTDVPTTQVPTKQPFILGSETDHDTLPTQTPVPTSSAPAQFRISNTVVQPLQSENSLSNHTMEKFAIFAAGLLLVMSLLVLFMKRGSAQSATDEREASQQPTRKARIIARMTTSFPSFSRSSTTIPRLSISFPSISLSTSVTSTAIPWPNVAWPSTGQHVSTTVCLPDVDGQNTVQPAKFDAREILPDDISEFYDETSYADTNDYDQQTVFSVGPQSIIS